MKKLRLSISNIILIIICLVVLVSVLVLNAVNSKSLISLRQSIDTLVIQNPSIGLLQETDKQLSVAENNYRIYLSTYDSTRRNAFLAGLSEISFNLQQIMSGADSADIREIVVGLDRKIELADMIAQLKKIADSVTTTTKSGYRTQLVQINQPIQIKRIDKSILEGFVINRVDTLKSVPKKKKGFFKKLGELFTNKEDAAPLEYAKGGSSQAGKTLDSTKTETASLDSSISQLSDEIQQFYQGKINEEFNIRKRLNETEKILAETNLNIIAQIDAALEILLQKELTARKQHLENALASSLDARNSIEKFSWGSLVIILVIVVLLCFNIIRLVNMNHS